jgi:Fe-S-cluster containining protein
MTLELKVQLVEQLFDQLEKDSTQFAKVSGIACAAGCGKCCTYPDVEATPLEFLPWAFNLFLSGKAMEMHALLSENQETTCSLFTPVSLVGEGHCSNYKYRGLICRLFGFAANSDKYGRLRLAACKIIKERQAENYAAVSDAIAAGLHVPVFTEYYMQLSQIDFHLGNKLLPVNKALKMALEEVLQYYAYRPLPDAAIECV